MERQEWLAERRKGIGSSDVSAILGIDPHRTPLDVWLSKVNPELLRKHTDEEQEVLDDGLELEPFIAHKYMKRTGLTLYAPPATVLTHVQYPELKASIDRVAYQVQPPRIVELKTELPWVDNFGDEGSDQAPDYYLCQAVHQMAVGGYLQADIALLKGTRAFRIYHVERDMELEKLIIDKCRQFWADYVLTKREPPVDSSESWRQYLQQKYPVQRGEIVKISPDMDVAHEVMELLKGRERLEEEKAFVDHHENTIKNWLAEREGLRWHAGLITWRKTKDTTEDFTRWDMVMEALIEASKDGPLTREAVKARIQEFTEQKVTRQGSRRFLIQEGEKYGSNATGSKVLGKGKQDGKLLAMDGS